MKQINATFKQFFLKLPAEFAGAHLAERRFVFDGQSGSELLLDDVALLDTLTGDTDGDGVVGVVDLNNVRNNFGGTGLGDTNKDHVVNLIDLNNVRNFFGASASEVTVPEPSPFWLAACGMATVLTRQIRRQSVR